MIILGIESELDMGKSVKGKEEIFFLIMLIEVFVN